MLSGTVDALERLLVKQATETMLPCHALHQGHHEHVVVDGQVGLLEDRSKLELVRGHLVVTGLARNAEFESLDLDVLHELLDT